MARRINPKESPGYANRNGIALLDRVSSLPHGEDGLKKYLEYLLTRLTDLHLEFLLAKEVVGNRNLG
jgi:hypothetical protein